MRNFIIAGVLFGSAAALLVYERNALAHSREQASAIAGQNVELNESIAGERTEIAELSERLKRQKEDMSRAERQLVQERAARQPVDAGKPDPAREGFWPVARPYFYLAKEHIAGIQYTAFGANGGVSDAAAALFGMSARERRGIEAVMRGLFGELHEVELKSAILTNTPPDAIGRPGRKVSVWLPPNAELAESKEKGAARVAEILGGGQRAALFLQRAAEDARDFDSFSPGERIVTLIATDEMKGEVIVTTGSGSTYHSYDRSQERGWVRFQYDHLLKAFLTDREDLQ